MPSSFYSFLNLSLSVSHRLSHSSVTIYLSISFVTIFSVLLSGCLWHFPCIAFLCPFLFLLDTLPLLTWKSISKALLKHCFNSKWSVIGPFQVIIQKAKVGKPCDSEENQLSRDTSVSIGKGLNGNPQILQILDFQKCKAYEYKRWLMTANHNNNDNFSNSGFKDKNILESEYKFYETINHLAPCPGDSKEFIYKYKWIETKDM